MRIVLLILLAFASTTVLAEDFYYVLDDDPANASATHYTTPDQACQVAYAADVPKLAALTYTQPQPYKAPTLSPFSNPPKYVAYDCNTIAYSPTLNGSATFSHSIVRGGDGCTADQTYNPQTGQCESADADQARKEMGDPGSAAVVGIVSCADPVNVGTGNVYESETDYADTDGELRFVRSYNSAAGRWTSTYETSLYINAKALVINFSDGRSALFKLSNGIATPEPTELGTMKQVSGSWVYTSPDNEQYTFNAQGKLTLWKLANGLSQSLTYVTSSDYLTVTTTVTDSRGHTLQFAKKQGFLQNLIVGGLTINYTVDTTFRLTNVTRNWAGHTTSRTYIYDDPNNPRLLTGITDERGIRSATWAYDAQGRAISNQRAGGAYKTTMTYNADGSTTVTNALGNSTTYRYQIIQGAKRVTAVEGEPAAGCPASNTTYTYTTNGQVDTKTDAIGTITAYTYDTLGREITRVEAKGTPQERTITTTWDATRFLPLTVTTADRVITYTYDTQGRPLSTSVHATKE
ncbi:DUF6531 domain-containing protein [Dyella sp. 2RAB6]|uniref:DUF6531 domain-containing protein n=1 Tax=Dyella sp. 2RAB6 TaxID=3232992 RepID=UPI003F91742A